MFLRVWIYVIFTSGSTGKPKGVMIEQGALVNFLIGMDNQLGHVFAAPNKLLAVTTIAFDIAGLELWGPLSQGGQVVLAAKEDSLDPTRLATMLSEHKINCMQATPATWTAMLSAGWAGERDLMILSGGEALPVDLAKSLLTLGRQLWNCYGPTEATIWSMVKQIELADLDQNSGLLGGALANYRHYVLDSNQQLSPVGAVGELCIGGESLARGYLNRDDLTAEQFFPDPYNDQQVGARLYRTGDLVRFEPDGNLVFIGRIDDQVKIRGYRIELGEVEAQLLACEQVAQGLVLAWEDQPGQQRLVAYVVASEASDSDVLVAGLKAQLREVLPQYMVPSAFVLLDKLPLTDNGKVNKKALPAPDGSHLHSDYNAPETDTERLLCDIWAELLKLEPGDISATANFFDIGGHSLLGVRLVTLVNSRFALELSIRDAFDQPRLRDFASLIEQMNQADINDAELLVDGMSDEEVALLLAQMADDE
jgi:amino acid adenylation domain-containing protein